MTGAGGRDRSETMFDLTRLSDGKGIKLSGRLDIERVHLLSRRLDEALSDAFDAAAIRWDLSDVDDIDSAAALVLWGRWGGQRPSRLELSQRHAALFEQLEEIDPETLDHAHTRPTGHGRETGSNPLTTGRGLVTVIGRFVLDLIHVIRHPSQFPLKELSAACFRTGATALPIVITVGVLIGIVLSYLSSLQLRQYGAESFLPLILGIGVVRELGPMLAAIVIAGRSGSAITAGIAAMRLTQELDALSSLGISHSLRLVFPRVVALAITVPLLVVCTDIAALAGGMISGWLELDLDPWVFVRGLHNDVKLAHFFIGLLKAFVFGLTIGLVACYFGLRAQANTQSLASETTRSVVLSISGIIVLDAMFAILFRGVPG